MLFPKRTNVPSPKSFALTFPSMIDARDLRVLSVKCEAFNLRGQMRSFVRLNMREVSQVNLKGKEPWLPIEVVLGAPCQRMGRIGKCQQKMLECAYFLVFLAQCASEETMGKEGEVCDTHSPQTTDTSSDTKSFFSRHPVGFPADFFQYRNLRMPKVADSPHKSLSGIIQCIRGRVFTLHLCF